MTINYTVFSTITGEILRTGSAMSVETAQLQGNSPNTKVILVDTDPQTQVISNPASDFPGVVNKPVVSNMVVNKTTFSANGIDGVTIPNIPAGAVAKILVPEGLGILPIADQTINDGSLTITTTVAGAYTITIYAFPKANYTVTVNAA